MLIILLYIFCFIGDTINKTVARPVVISTQSFTFFYVQDFSSHVLILLNQLGPDQSNTPEIVFIKSSLIKLSSRSSFLKAIWYCLRTNKQLETFGVSLDSDESVAYSEFRNSVLVTNTSETNFAFWGFYQVFSEPAISIFFVNKGFTIDDWTSEKFKGLGIENEMKPWSKISEMFDEELLKGSIESTGSILMDWAQKM